MEKGREEKEEEGEGNGGRGRRGTLQTFTWIDALGHTPRLSIIIICSKVARKVRYH